MATALLYPISETDVDSNIQSGSFTDIDDGIAGDSVPIIFNDNRWTNQVNNTTGGLVSFGITNTPGDYGTFNSIDLAIRVQVTGGVDLDLVTWRMDISGTNAPSTVLSRNQSNDGGGYATINFTDSAVTPSQGDIDGWIVRVYQWTYTQDMGPDGLQLEIDEIELTLDYDVAVAGAGPNLLTLLGVG